MDPKLMHDGFTPVSAEVVSRLDNAAPGAGLFLARELEHVMAETLEERQPSLNAFSVFPADRSVPPHATSYTHRMLTAHGVAKWIADYSSDLPAVGVGAVEETFNVRDCGVSYGYSVKEVMAATAVGRPLSRSMASAARRSTEERQNETAFKGDKGAGLFGLADFPHFPRMISTVSIDSNSTADEILGFLHSVVNQTVTRTKGRARPSRMIMPLLEYTYIATTARSATSDTTILEYFIRTSPYVNEVLPVPELDDLGPGGVPLLACYEPNVRIIGHVLPMLFSQMPAQNDNLAVKVPCMASSGGICSDYPLEVTVAEFAKSA